MQLNFRDLNQPDAYRWMNQVIVPRPIAWVSTISPSGITNLAPFSYFQGVTSSPPTLLFIPVNDRNGFKKDTLSNLELIPEFVVNIPTTRDRTAVDLSSQPIPSGVSEFDEFNIDYQPSHLVSPPRVLSCPISIECIVDRILPLGSGPFAPSIILGTIQVLHIDDDLIEDSSHINWSRFKPLARLSNTYCTVTPCQ